MSMTAATQNHAIANWLSEPLSKKRLFTNDLNSMNEAVMKLPSTLFLEYLGKLHFVVFGVEANDICNIVCSFRMTEASASQRCEALCRTLWPERWIA